MLSSKDSGISLRLHAGYTAERRTQGKEQIESVERYVQVACSASGLCPGTTAQALTVVTAPVISLVNSIYLSSVVEVKQVSTCNYLCNIF